jgi:acetyl esterase/lipase
MTTRRTFLAATALMPVLATPLAAASRAAQEATPTVPQGAIKPETDIAYGEVDGETLLLDVYRPSTQGNTRPAVIIIHGGGWSEGFGRDYVAPFAEHLAAAGYVAFNIDYRLMNGERGHNVWPTQLNDVQRAVRWVRASAETYGVDPERIASLGHSAGGQLASMLGVRETNDYSDPTAEVYSSRVNCAIDLSGDIDLALPYPAAFDNALVRDYLGGSVEDVPDVYRDASPVTWVNAETVPFLVVHSANDEINPVAHARELVAALHEASVETVHVELGRGGHMATADWATSGPWVLTFLATQLDPGR